MYRQRYKSNFFNFNKLTAIENKALTCYHANPPKWFKQVSITPSTCKQKVHKIKIK